MRKKMKQLGAVLLSLTLLLCGCDGQGGNNDGEGSNVTSSGKMEITLWHTWGTKTSAHLQKIADDYNASQDKYEVVLYNQDSASTIRQKLNTLKQENYPSIFCGQPTSTRYYDSASFVMPIQEYIDKDSEDWTADIYTNIKSSYSNQDGEMIGSPFGVSCDGYFVNVDAIEKAGYSVADLTSFEKIAEIAKATVNKKICKYGISFYGAVDLLNMMTLQGVDLVDADNGHSGAVTESLMVSNAETNATLKKAVGIYQSLYKDGVAFTYGSGVSNEAMPVFYNGDLAFCMATNSFSHYIVDNGVDFKYAFVPAVAVDSNAKYQGTALCEGTGFYMCDTGNDEEMQGAYEFIKYAANAENQAYWCSSLGYVPFTDAAAEQAVYAEWVNTNFPSLLTVREKISTAPADLHGPYTEMLDNINNQLATILSYITTYPNDDMNQYIQDADETLTEEIEIYNLKNK